MTATDSAEPLRRAAQAVWAGHPAVQAPYRESLGEWLMSHALRVERGSESLDDFAVRFAALINDD